MRQNKTAVLYLAFLLACSVASCTGSHLEPQRTQLTQLSVGGGWASVSWSSDSNKLLLVNLGMGEPSKLYIYDLQTRSLLPIAESSQAGDNRIVEADWDPLGERIAYAESRGVVHVITIEGTSLMSELSGYRAAWTPDGKALAIADRQGVRILEVGQDSSVVWEQSKVEIEGALTAMDWSPSGDSILFSLSTFDEDTEQADLYVLDVVSGDVTLIIPTSTANETDPTWSPDGQWISYIRRDVVSLDTFLVVATADLDRELIIAESSQGGIDSPAWSPDGKHFAFIDRGKVYIVDTGTVLQQITEK